MSQIEHFRIYIAAYLILEKENQVLLLRRFNTGYMDGFYSFVAGHLDGVETAKECIAREAKEEAGIELILEDLTIKHVLHRYRSDREYIDIFLTADHWQGEIENREPHKCDDLHWFNKDELPENFLPYLRFVFEQIEQGHFYSEFGWEQRKR
jgi:mutator protein MutT